MRATWSRSVLLTVIAVAGCTAAGIGAAIPSLSVRPSAETLGATRPTGASSHATATSATTSTDCPVTVPDAGGFVAPRPYPPAPPAYYGSRWYGNADLWTMIDTTGESWHHLPRNGTARGQKTFWWSADWDHARELEPAIVVTGRRLDGPASAFEAGHPGTNATADFGTAMLVGVDVPTPGCWELLARYRTAELAIVVWVADD